VCSILNCAVRLVPRIFDQGNALIFAAVDAAALTLARPTPGVALIAGLAPVPAGAAETDAARATGTAAPRNPRRSRNTRAHQGDRVPRAATRVNLHAVLDGLTGLDVNELLVECGPRLAAGVSRSGSGR